MERSQLMNKQSLAKLSKAELYQRAQKAGVAGRSEMGKEELLAALSNGGAGASSDGSRPKSRSTTTRAKRVSRRRMPKTKPSPTSSRSIWTGAITFGLITIPVGIYTATEDRDISFHLLSGKDKSRIEYKRVSAKTG